MIVQIQISDRVYTQLLNGNKRIQGTLALANPTEGNFNEHRREWRPKPGTRYMRLPHGRVTVSEEQVRMNLAIRRDESIVPARAIEAESGLASSFMILWRTLYELWNSNKHKEQGAGVYACPDG